MKVRITTTVEVDPDAWAADFGVDRKEVRDDVRAYFSNWIQGHVDSLGLQLKKEPHA